MTTPLTHTIRTRHGFLRSVAAVVLVTFTGLILQPTALAIQTLPDKPKPAQAAETNSAKLAKTNQKLLEKLERTEAKLARKESITTELDDLQALHNELNTLDTTAMQDFAAIEKHLKAKKLPDVILKRHTDAVATYRKEMDTVLTNLSAITYTTYGMSREGRTPEAIDKEKDAALRTQKLKQAKDHLKAKKHRRAHQPFDPNQLPFRIPDGKVRPPKETKAELQALFNTPEPIQLASTHLSPGLLMTVASDTPQPADLAATEDVQLTPDIEALAAELNHNPVTIYNWVHNTIEFVPTYGSIQGAQLTLETKKGNAFDTASLLIALLRASDIPARYVYGTVQIPIDPVMNWVGGVTVPEAALQLLAQGGIPSTGLATGGKVVAVKLEHVWVEAWVDFAPSRGAKHIEGDTWVPMDGSFKQYQYTTGMNLAQTLPFDQQALLAQIELAAESNAAEGWVRNVDENIVQSALTSHQSELQAYVNSQKANATVADVFGDKQIIASQRPVLSAGLPYQLNVRADAYAEIPATLRHTVRFAFYATERDSVFDTPAFSINKSLPAIAGQRIELSYNAATPDDQAVIDGALADGDTSLPGYVIHMTPVLKIAGNVIQTGSAARMGEGQAFSVTITTPMYEQRRDLYLSAGDFFVWGLDAAGTPADVWEKRTRQYDLNNPQLPDFTAELYHQILLGYFAEYAAFWRLTGDIDRVIYYQLPSHGFAGTPLSIDYLFGIPRTATYQTRLLDIKENRIVARHVANDAAVTRDFVQKSGYIGSYLESGIYDQAFLIPEGHSMSAVTAMRKANQEGQRIYRINQNNLNAVLPVLTVDSDVKADITRAVQAGLEATVPQHNITVDNFDGVGYYLIDPITGSGSYRISGGRDGNNSPSQASVIPLPEVPLTPIVGLMLGSLVRQAGATLAVNAAGALEIVIAGGAAGGPIGLIVAAVIVALWIAFSISQTADTEYPRTSILLRKYVSSDRLLQIAKNGVIGASGPTEIFPGNAVYFTDPFQVVAGFEPVNAGVGCPVTLANALLVATAYQIPGPNEPPNPERAESFIEIEILRENYFDIRPIPNVNGAIEIVIASPLIPYPNTEADPGPLSGLGLLVGTILAPASIVRVERLCP